MDIGSGPTLYQVMSGCEHFNRVILSDFLEVNRNELNKWLKDGQSNFDWTPYLKRVCELEGRRWDVRVICAFQPGSLHIVSSSLLLSCSGQLKFSLIEPHYLKIQYLKLYGVWKLTKGFDYEFCIFQLYISQ